MSISQPVTSQSPNPSSEYVYKPLAFNTSKKQHIRVVHLFPAANIHDEIQCSLVSTSLGSNILNIQYEALSYVWGNPNDRKAIRLNGHIHHVTANLFDALQHLRSKDETRTLWIDAICINQKDDQEKGIQVALMGRIYKEALRTIAWLGLEGTANLALGFCETLDDIPPSAPNLSSEQARYWSEHPHSTAACQELFYDCAYWYRLWIVQELCLNSSTVFQLGCRQISFDEFYPLWNKYFSYEERRQNTIASSTSVDQTRPQRIGLRATFLSSVLYYRGMREDMHFTHLLTCFKHQSVMDPRDRVYGLLGLASQGWRSEITPDYTRSLRDVYISIAVKLVNTDDLNFLPLVEAADREITCAQLPSWVPDLATHETTHSPTWQSHWSRLLIRFRSVTHLAKFSLTATTMMNEDTAILFLPGLSLGVVTELHRPRSMETSRAPIYFSYTRDPQRGDLQPTPKESIESVEANWGPCKMKRGDVIVSSPFIWLPLILRQYKDGFLFVGTCFLIDAPLRPDPNYALEFDVEGPGFSDIMRGSLMKDIESVEQLETFKIY